MLTADKQQPVLVNVLIRSILPKHYCSTR